MISSNAFSQKDTTQVIIPSETARLVIKDLIRGDAAQKELVIFRSKVNLLETKITRQDLIITDLFLQKSNYLSIIETKDKQFGYSQDINNLLQADLKKEKAKNKILSVGGGTIFVILVFSLISK